VIVDTASYNSPPLLVHHFHSSHCRSKADNVKEQKIKRDDA
jgi:hypothetical protein